MASAIVQSTTPVGERDFWQTPPHIFERAARRYGPFDLDAAANEHNRLCPFWFGPGSELGEDGLAEEWGPVSSATMPARPVRVWLNPPYSNTAAWVAKAATEAKAGRAQTTMLLPSTTDVRWFHDWVVEPQYGSVRPGVVLQFLKGRVCFLRPDGTEGKSPNGGSVLVTFLAA